MSRAPARRIGLIGFGHIGSRVYERVTGDAGGPLEIAFVHNRNPARLAEVPAHLRLDDLAQMQASRPDLVVEMAHPDYTREWGARILGFADYMPLSVTALADDSLFETLRASARSSGHRLLIPHGALMGIDNLFEWRHMWQDVAITFVKNPVSIDFSQSGYDASAIAGDTVVYDGPVRGIANLYPRNVNTMVTCALATVGLDRCRARLVASPGANSGVIEIRATGRDGAVLEMRKEQPMVGVSGSEMFESQFRSILRAAGALAEVDFL